MPSASGSSVMVTVDAPGARSIPRFPAPGEDDALARLDLLECAGGVVAGSDGPAVVAAYPKVNAGRHRLPAAQTFRLGDERKGLVGADGQVNGFIERHESGPLS